MILYNGPEHRFSLIYNPRDYAQATLAVTRWRTAGLLTPGEYDSIGQQILRNAQAAGVLFAEAEERLDAIDEQPPSCLERFAAWVRRLIRA